MNTPYQFTSTELQARQIISDARSVDWSPTQQLVLNAMSAMYYSSLPAERVAQIGRALEGCDVDLYPVQKVLTALVRRKVLRSRSISGVTHYELNY